MKKTLFTAMAVILFVQLGLAQNCSQFISAVNGKKLVYANVDGKGKDMGKFNYTSTKKDNSTVAVHTEIFDKTGKSMGNSDSEIKCNGEAISIDMKSLIPTNNSKQFGGSLQASGDAKYITYPLNMKPGQKLDDGTVTINMSNNGSQVSTMKMDITNRQVEQAEKVTTKAGDFDCFKIGYDATVKVTMMGVGFPVHLHVTEWFSPKLARPIKSETANKGGKVMGSMELESIN